MPSTPTTGRVTEGAGAREGREMAAARKTSFVSAARRHLSDADYLEVAGRRMNADHLYGFAWECALKALMIGHGMPMQRTAGVGWRPSVHSDRIHADRCLERLQHYATSRAHS